MKKVETYTLPALERKKRARKTLKEWERYLKSLPSNIQGIKNRVIGLWTDYSFTDKTKTLFNYMLTGFMVFYTVSHIGTGYTVSNYLSWTSAVILTHYYVPWLVKTIKG